MSRHKNFSRGETLTKQIQNNFDSRLAIGVKKHDVSEEMKAEKIFSWSTYRTYMKECCYFAQYCRDVHGCRTLDQCKQYVEEWLFSRSERGLSPWTLKMEKSALCKLYRMDSKDIHVDIAKRSYASAKRSRGEVERDSHFSEDRNRDLVAFAKSTGLRRSELLQLRGYSLLQKRSGEYVLRVTKNTKGGLSRTVPIVGDVDLVVRLCTAAGKGKVFPTVHAGADIHAYRREYAQRLYDSIARPLSVCENDKTFVKPKHENPDRDAVYRRRGALRGTWLDKRAMVIVSEALGHHRISVVGENYLK